IVIGAGPAGENVGPRVVRGGLSAALVEEALVGGDCAYYACIPSKALLRPVALAADVRRMPGRALAPLRGTAGLTRPDAAGSYLDDGKQVKGIQSVPAELVRGRGRLRGPKQVEVTTRDGAVRMLRARHAVVLATGSYPVIPPTPGLAEASPWVSRDATSV